MLDTYIKRNSAFIWECCGMLGKNVAADIARRAKNDRPKCRYEAWKLLDISPPM